MTQADEKSLDGLYARLLRRALDVSWEDHMNNFDLYGSLSRLTEKEDGRTQPVWQPDLVASGLVLLEPAHDSRSVS